ncbi:MAG TPA: tetratricopeptide repeat protein [Kiritimatiellia bacterium]|jgi:outer membrane protein assembly factor BamD (BamD/ComL family)|nr:tetratricopeptide repeat protein [Kiritimatiellia bacterium]OQC59629.1 MAG: tol-pal system protein YbgF [Verrucomicrobia bacterium ADurb.Bin018]HOE01134.1 tetratricopeptide repeat protein [Kiritimatiellia bacterium]HOE37753.1 tetratricopeptide repeat protein [Kiritimatiellia bacterium]HOR75143.1 tetratricopeptide repeat protein [Kiritimatiellia bacterium]
MMPSATKRLSTLLTSVALASLLHLPALAQQSQQGPDDSPEALYQSGMSRFVAGNYEQSVEFLEQLVKVFGKEPELRTQIDLAMYARACALYNLSRWADSIKAFEEYIAQYPESKFADEAMFRIASAQQQLEEYELAVAAYQKLRSAYPRSPYSEDALYQTGICRLIQENHALAAAAFADFMRLYENSPLWGQAGAFCARATFDDGKGKEAIALLETIEKRPRSWSVITYCNFLAFEIGDYMFNDTEYELALKAYRRVKTRRALQTHMQNYVRTLEAQLAATQSGRMDMRNLRSHFQEERRLANELAQAKEMATKLDELPDYDANLFHRIGRCFFNTDRYWEARAAFTRVVAIATEDTVREAGHFDLILAISRLRRFNDLVIECDHYLSTYDPEGKWE